jgi:hypothetical protein
MASSSVRDITPSHPQMADTVDNIKFILLLLTDLIIRFPAHTSDDAFDITVFLIRQINDVRLSLAS